jgi:hypothetical protein
MDKKKISLIFDVKNAVRLEHKIPEPKDATRLGDGGSNDVFGRLAIQKAANGGFVLSAERYDNAPPDVYVFTSKEELIEIIQRFLP